MVNESAEISGINKIRQSPLLISITKMVVCRLKKKHGGKRNMKLNALLLNKIDQITEENLCINLKRICDKILESKQVELSINSTRNGLKQLRITFKCASLQVDC